MNSVPGLITNNCSKPSCLWRKYGSSIKGILFIIFSFYLRLLPLDFPLLLLPPDLEPLDLEPELEPLRGLYDDLEEDPRLGELYDFELDERPLLLGVL